MLKNKSTPIFSRIKLAIRRKKISDNIVKIFYYYERSNNALQCM